MLNKEEKEQLKKDWLTMGKKQLIDKYQIKSTTLYHFVKENGLPLKRSKNLTPEQREYILAHKDKPYAEIARDLGITYGMVARLFKKKKPT